MKLQSIAYFTAVVVAALIPTPTRAATEIPPYQCETDAECDKKFPGTACVVVDLYEDTVKKCTPNTKERPACRGGQPGLCPSYQSEEVGYLNVHCVFVAKDVDAEGSAPVDAAASATTSSKSSKVSSGSGSDAGKTKTRFLIFAADFKEEKAAAVPAATKKAASSSGSGEAEIVAPSGSGSGKTPVSGSGVNAGSYAKVKVGNQTVTGEFKCVDVSDCENQAYDPTTCDPKECGPPGSKTICNNHGTCTYPSIQTMSKRRCMCYKGYIGDKCQQEASNECDVDCGMGGDCIDGECKCKKGFDGKAYKGKKGKPNQRCTKCTNDQACQNGNACDIETGACVCGPGFFGPTCGATEDSCTKTDCGNGVCKVEGNGTSACYCSICAPDCQLCKGKDCSMCPSPATTATLSKSVVFVTAIAGLFVGNLLM